MSRDVSSDMLTALSSSMLFPALFVEATFASTTVYMWTGVGSISWNSQTWLGLGSFMGLSTTEDSSNVEAKGITLTLSGLDATLLPEAMTDFKLGLPVVVYLGLFSSGTLIDSPLIVWSGRMDQPSFDVSGSEVTLSINCESRLIDMNIAVDRRYTLEDQQMDWPGDLGFQFIDSLQEKTLFWGQYPATTNNI